MNRFPVDTLNVGDTIITDSDGSARTIRAIRQVGNLIRLTFDDGRVHLAPPSTCYTLAKYATRPVPRTHTVAIEMRGDLTRRAAVYVSPGTMYHTRWFTVMSPAAVFDNLIEAQEWLVRVIGYEALDHEIHGDRFSH